MGKIRQAVKRFVRATGWNWQERKDGSAMRTFITGDNGVWSMVVDWSEDEDFFGCYAICSTNAPTEARPAVAEYLTRANWRLCLCNFEMDYEDGEIRLRMGLPLSKDSLSQAMIKDIVLSSNTLMDRYLPGLMKVVFGGATAEEAFRQVTAAHEKAGKNGAAAQQGDGQPMTRRQRAEQHTRRVLWIDDHIETLPDTLVDILGGLGYGVFALADNDKALAFVKDPANSFDLVIQDLQRPPGECLHMGPP